MLISDKKSDIGDFVRNAKSDISFVIIKKKIQNFIHNFDKPSQNTTNITKRMVTIMLAFVSFILVIVGALNWFSIGILQYDFVAGIFGSQSNIFSRLIYTLVGVASVIVTANLIANKGKFVVSFKKAEKEYENYKQEKKSQKQRRLAKSMEAGEDESENNKSDNNYSYSNDAIDAKDTNMYKSDNRPHDNDYDNDDSNSML